jgi:hypothetical protein
MKLIHAVHVVHSAICTMLFIPASPSQSSCSHSAIHNHHASGMQKHTWCKLLNGCMMIVTDLLDKLLQNQRIRHEEHI